MRQMIIRWKHLSGYELKGERVKRVKAKCNGHDSDRIRETPKG